MKTRFAALAGASLLGATLFAGAGTAGPGFMNKYPSTTVTMDCGGGDTVTYTGPLKMWPPNHKLQDVSVIATDGGDDNGSDQTNLTATITLTDASGGDGGPNHDPDYTPGELADSGDPSAEVPFFLRSERSGKGDGRTYTINWAATFDGGSKECSSEDGGGRTSFVVTVPHDMRGGANWK